MVFETPNGPLTGPCGKPDDRRVRLSQPPEATLFGEFCFSHMATVFP